MKSHEEVSNNNNSSISSNNEKKWTTKDKLFLVSSVLVNGDQNWSLISEQLRRIHEYEVKNKNDYDDDDVQVKQDIYTLSVSILKS